MRLSRLLANLSFNPSLITQVGFYAVRLHKEASIRRIGLIFTAMAMVVQMAAALVPAKSTQAAANANDIVYGGGSKDSFLHAIRQNSDGLGRRDIRAVFEHFLGSGGAAEIAIQNGVEETIHGTSGNNYWSIGRAVRDGGDIPLGVPGAHTAIYQRTLHGWGEGRTWRVLRVRSAINGQDMWIMLDCGNIVTRGPYQHHSPSPHVNKVANPAAGTHVKPGQKITYSLLFGNHGPGNMIGTILRDRVPAHTTLDPNSYWGHGTHSDTYNDTAPGQIIRWWPHNPEKVWGADGNSHAVYFTVTVNQDAPDGVQICNSDMKVEWADNGQNHTKWLAYPVCHVVHREKCPIPGKGHLEPNHPDCKEPEQAARCEYFNEILPANDRRKRQFKAKGLVENGAQLLEYSFDYNNDGAVEKVIPANGTEPVEFDYTLPDQTAVYQARVGIKAKLKGAVVEDAGACFLEVDVPLPPVKPGEPLITITKKVRNITRNLEDANNTTAQPGDELEYALISENVGDAEKKDHQLTEEDLGDVLEYAEIMNLGDGILKTQTKTLQWPVVTIKPGDKVVKTILVRVKDPLPTNAVSPSTPQSFDLKMQNHYGTTATVNLEKPLPKQVENVGKSLPNTGPGWGLTVTFMITTMVAYYFMRSRILAKELDVVRSEYAAGGI